MKPLRLSNLPQLHLQFQRFFPVCRRRALWREIEPRNYNYTLTPSVLVQAFLIAFAARLSGLRAIAARCAHVLGTSAFSSLAPALRRNSSLGFVRGLVAQLETTHRPGCDDVVALDSMALTLPKTQRHHCKPFGNRAVGGGVLWAFQLRAKKGRSPLKVLRLLEGPWHDSKTVRGVGLEPNGPLYLMDRGFYALDLLAHWLDQRVHFLVRAKAYPLVYQVLDVLSVPHHAGHAEVTLDALVRLGGANAKAYPIVRLVRARLASGDELILVTDQIDASPEKLLALYRQRWHIERFHRFVKDAVGLAHLYSFDQQAIHFLLYTVLLLALLLYFSQHQPRGETLALMQTLLKTLRDPIASLTPWRRNTYSTPPRKNKWSKS